MSAVRSTEVFREKLVKFGLDGFQTRFDNKGWNTISAFAFSCGFQCEAVTDRMLIDTVIAPFTACNGAPPEPVVANNFRQLFWDCIQAHMADTRAQYDPRSMQLPIRMASPERGTRRDTFAARMIGHVPNIMEGDLEPAWSTEDMCYDMVRG